jgi:hypothetical protein
MKYLIKRFAFGFSMVLLIAACIPTPTPAPTPLPSSTPLPTSTPVTPTLTPVPTQTATPTLTPIVTEITVKSPREGDKVEHITTIEGTSKNIPDGSAIWAVIFLPTVQRFFPVNDPAVILVNGDWTAQAYFGRPDEIGLEAVVYVVLADNDAQAAFRTYLAEAKSKDDYPGLEKMPDGALPYVLVHVTRK